MPTTLTKAMLFRELEALEGKTDFVKMCALCRVAAYQTPGSSEGNQPSTQTQTSAAFPVSCRVDALFGSHNPVRWVSPPHSS